MIYFTSDLHLFHDKEFIWLSRKFSNVEHMSYALIDNINEMVVADDTLYILGDLVLNNTEEGIKLLRQIKCRDIHIIIGNHDTPNRIAAYKALPQVKEVVYTTVLKYRKYTFYLSHYPTITSNVDDTSLKSKVINLCGHTHTEDKFEYFNDKMCSYNVGVDAQWGYPISIEKIIEQCKTFISK